MSCLSTVVPIEIILLTYLFNTFILETLFYSLLQFLRTVAILLFLIKINLTVLVLLVSLEHFLFRVLMFTAVVITDEVLFYYCR